MNKFHDTLRILRHDYKYHLDTIGELLSSGNKEETEKYLSEIKTQFANKELPVFCSNSVLNALLAGYAERCANVDISFSAKISLPDRITVPNYEMCIVLGNLLENAVEACNRQDGIRKIVVVVNTQGANLAIMVKNSYSGEVTQDSDRLVSKKKDGGLGLRSVQAVASRHNGELMTEWDDKIFSAYVLMQC
jgi:sensor histidine kinase regulating citrate/malate metabolism